MEYSIGEFKALIDVEKTQKLYQALERHINDTSAAINYARNVRLRSAAMQDFFGPIGIEPLSFQNLQVESIDALKQTVCYYGCYPLDVENKDLLLASIAKSIEKDVYLDAVHTDFGYELSFDAWNGMVAIYFYVELPWLFFPPIDKGKYVNKVKLPTIDQLVLDI